MLWSCKPAQVITNTETTKVIVKDSLIYTPPKVIRDTLRLFDTKDTVIYKDRISVRLVSDTELSDSLINVINSLNLQLEVNCPDDTTKVQIERTDISNLETKIEQEPDFFERHWWKILLGLFIALILSKIANKFV